MKIKSKMKIKKENPSNDRDAILHFCKFVDVLTALILFILNNN